MPDDDMEISTDLGQPSYGEDLDIDLDFAVGQPDEDMELGDFDPAQELHNFNSDTRDELMAEGDDASYGMIDADDIDHNQAATASNDIEIDLGDADQNLWQEGTTLDEDFANANEIDYNDNTCAEDINVEEVTRGDTNWLEASSHLEVDSAQNGSIEVNTMEETLYVDAAVPSEGGDFQGTGVSEATHNDAKLSSAIDTQEIAPETEQGTLDDSLNVGLQPQEQDAGDEKNESVNGAVVSSGDTSQEHLVLNPEAHGEAQDPLSHNEVVEAEDDQPDGRDVIRDQTQAALSVPSEGYGNEDDVKYLEHDDRERTPLNFNALEDQLGGDKIEESANDPTFREDSTTQDATLQDQAVDPDTSNGHSQSGNQVSGSETQKETGVNEDDGARSSNGHTHVESPASIATRYEMYISYGQTDYKLFAKSEDDDPNGYFLSDLSALELPLCQFLSNLRDVISEEISPLDELVLHVDGLGLEFSESSTNDFLEKFSFGDILGLYDRLVKNDGAVESPDLYTYLMIRPSCNQRLMALVESANSGRGLSEIALYRESTPFEDDRASESDSHAPVVVAEDTADEDAFETQQNGHEEGEFDGGVGAEGNTEANPPTLPASTTEAAADEEIYEFQENGHEEDEFEGATGAEGDAETNLPSNLPSTQALTTEAVAQTSEGQAGEPTDNANSDVEEKPADDYIDFSDDELDITPSKQGQTTENRAPETQEQQPGPPATETTESRQRTPPTTAPDAPTHVPNSDNTSVTATLNGDEQDEIDYSDDEVETGVDDAGTSQSGTGRPTTLKVPLDDEITWESENEDAKNEVGNDPKQTVQVSPAPGKRSRSDMDGPEGAGEENDVKRRRS